jgi:ABC-type transporter Mla subunit MlaD
MAKSSRVPDAVGALPVVGGLMRQADQQAQWVQDLMEQNARLVGQFPETLKTINDSLERFNQTVQALDRTVARIETATAQLVGPLEAVTPRLDLLSSAIDRMIGLLGDLPGAGLVRRVTGRPAGRPTAAEPPPAGG